MASGVKIDTEIVKMANSFNQGAAREKYAFLTAKIADDKKSIIWDEAESLTKVKAGMRATKPTDEEAEEEENKRYAALRKQLSDETPRWYMYDCFKWIDSRKVDKVIWIHWCPDTVNIKSKMLYASSKDAFKRAVDAKIMIECSDFEDVEHDRLLSFLK